MKCTKLHALAYSSCSGRTDRYKEGFVCDVCGARPGINVDRWWCDLCTYDVCQACAAKESRSFTDLFDEVVFRAKVDEALLTVRKILDTTKTTLRADDALHTYEDKFALVDHGTRNAVAALYVALEALGLSAASAEQLLKWARGKQSVSLRFASAETCTFEKKTTRDVVLDKSSTSYVIFKATHKTVETITEWHWTFTVTYTLQAFVGSSPDAGAVTLLTRACSAPLVSTVEASPRPATRVCTPIDVNITWLVARIETPSSTRRSSKSSEKSSSVTTPHDLVVSALKSSDKTTTAHDLVVGFTIDRLAKTCHTPRRNADVDDALGALQALSIFVEQVTNYFVAQVFPAQSMDKVDFGDVNDKGVFVPVLPLLMRDEDDDARGLVFTIDDERAMLAEQKRSLLEKFAKLESSFGEASGLLTVAEAQLLSACAHIGAVCVRYARLVDFVERMLEKQLIAGIGKSLTARDFGVYMDFHARRLMAPAFRPLPLVAAIRRPDHCPEGELMIEADLGEGALPQPLQAFSCTRHADDSHPMFFRLGAATRLRFCGEQTVHSVLMYQFSSDGDASLRLSARARQFSSFVMMIGTMESANSFAPTHAMIVKNKDDFVVNLLTETIPSAKQFRDAIESLSPEQQRFAKQFRAMQLESSMFAVVFVQIKPQLELLLRLPPDALTKHLQLCEDLLDLFHTYQIPADLLSYEGYDGASVESKVAVVEQNVRNVKEMIQEAKDAEVREAAEKAAFELARRQAEEARVRAEEQQKMLERSRAVDRERVQYQSQMMPGSAPPRPMAMRSSVVQSAGPIHMMSSASPMPTMSSAPMAKSAARPSPATRPAPSAPSPAKPAAAAPPPAPVATPVSNAAATTTAAPPPPTPQPTPPPTTTTTTPTPTTEAPPEAKPESTSSSSDKSVTNASNVSDEGQGALVDYTALPAQIDQRIDALTIDTTVRPTTIKLGNTWTKRFHRSLLSARETNTLGADQLKTEKNRAFDLLDAISRSGALPLVHSSLHVVLASTLCFDKSLLETVTHDNVNPIERAEAVCAIMNAICHGVDDPMRVVGDGVRERVVSYSPKLLTK